METSLTRLRHIIAVARTESFSRAADEEGITQPALSRSIQSFERQHGVTLFERGRGGVTLTQAGALVVRHARGMLDAACDLDRSIRAYGEGEAGRVALGIGPMLASVLLPRLASAMLKERPGLQLMTTIRAPEQMVEALLDDSIDLVIGPAWHLAQAPWINVEPLGHLSLVHAVRAGHPLAGQDVFHARLASYPLAGASDLQLRNLPPNSGAFVCENFHVIGEIVAQTDCIWLTTPELLYSQDSGTRFAVLDVIDRPAGTMEICIASRRGRSTAPAIGAVAAEARRLMAAIERPATSASSD